MAKKAGTYHNRYAAQTEKSDFGKKREIILALHYFDSAHG
jgi:hypothetical protein